MPNALVVDVANQVKVLLDTHTFNPVISAAVKYNPSFSIAELSTLRVTVCPRSKDEKDGTRSSRQYEIGVDIAVQKKVTDEDAELPALLYLVEQISEFLRLKVVTSSGFKATWKQDKNEPIYDMTHLRGSKIFSSALSITYVTVK